MKREKYYISINICQISFKLHKKHYHVSLIALWNSVNGRLSDSLSPIGCQLQRIFFTSY